MSNTKKFADALGVEPEILPYFAELLADIWDLGSWPEEIIKLLRPLELPKQSTKVLDLGCGKGAVTLPIARKLGFQVRGVDLFPPFIEEARVRAVKMDVEYLCHYEVGDIRDVLKEGNTYDIVIFASVGGVLGDFEKCVGQMRAACRPGGYLVIDDGFSAHSSRLDRPGYEHYRSHDKTIRQLTCHGDKLLREIIFPVAKLQAYNQRNTELIRKKADKLAKQHPESADLFKRYVRWEEDESYILETETIPATWLLQKN